MQKPHKLGISKPEKENTMRRIITTLKATIALSCLIAASTGGFMAGGYWHTQKMEKAALAHDCASLDPKTLAFSWRLPIDMGITIDTMPDIAPVKSKKAGAK